MYLIEPCPLALAGQPQPCYGGKLFFHQETGKAGCPGCGWSGVANFFRGRASTRCPACGQEPTVRVDRNRPCPCGSGLKGKRCGCTDFYA